MSEWFPEGYISLTALTAQHGLDSVRGDLFAGRLLASRWDKVFGSITPISASFWCSDDGERWLAAGRSTRPSVFDGYLDHPPVELIIVKVKDEPKTEGGYVPPFIALMMKAVRHFEISEQSWPKKEELVAHFLDQRLPDGTQVSENQARYLATFCRPIAAMSGGNK